MGSGARGGLGATGPNIFTTGDCLCGLCSLESLERVAKALTGVRGHQKVVLFIGSDIVIDDMRAPQFCQGRIKPAREAMLRALDKANVTVHSIDPTGLESLASGVGAVERSFGAVRQHIQIRQGNLAVLPSYTGGRVVRDSNAPTEIVPEIFGETSSYYLLGFERGGSSTDAAQRPVRVRVNRPGVTVITRKAYYPPSPVPTAAEPNPLDHTITAVLPISDVPMALSLASVFTSSGEVKINVLIGMKDASPAAQAIAVSGAEAGASTVEGRFDLVLGVFDDRAKTILTRSNPLQIRSGSCAGEWCETMSQIELKPGRYEVRTGVLDRTAARQGSVYGYIEVPQLRSDTFLLSDLQIGAETSGVAVPSVSRVFRPEERLSLFTQIHRPVDSAAPVTFRVAIADVQARAVAQNSSTLDASSFSASGVSDVKIDQPLSKLTPGSYTLTVEASHLDRVTRRSVAFEVK